MNSSTMLYKLGGEHLLHGHKVDYIIVPEVEVAERLADGWALTPDEAAQKPTEPKVKEKKVKKAEIASPEVEL